MDFQLLKTTFGLLKYFGKVAWANGSTAVGSSRTTRYKLQILVVAKLTRR